MSKLIPKFSAIIREGKMFINNREIFDLYIGTLDGKNVEVIVQEFKKIRSTKSNCYYRVYLNLLFEETGQDPNELHELFKIEFLPKEEITLFGKKTYRTLTTTDLTPAEFSTFIRQIEVLTGIISPDPYDYYIAK